MTVRLYIRIRLSGGGRQYADPVYSANGKLKPFYALRPPQGPTISAPSRMEAGGMGVCWLRCPTGHEAMTLRLKLERVLEAQRVGVEVVREVEDLEFKLINSSIYKAEHGRLRMLV